MAAPTITWYPYTGSSPGTPGSSITSVDFGNVQAGSWSDVKAVQATFSGSANTLKFWLNDTDGLVGGSPVDVSNSSGSWNHRRTISGTYTDPSTLSGASLASALEETDEPASANMSDVTSGGSYKTDFLYLALQPPSDATDGLTNGWSYRLSFLYP